MMFMSRKNELFHKSFIIECQDARLFSVIKYFKFLNIYDKILINKINGDII